MKGNSPISIDLEEMISYAKSLPTWEDARPIANYLNWQFRNSGTPEVFACIDSICRHFKEHNEEALFERLSRQLEVKFRKELGLSELTLTDEQVAECVVELMKYLGYDNQWLAIYRILVDFCGFPKEIQSFCDRMDECLSGRRIDRPCKYQNIQKNLNGIFKKSYRQWCVYPRQEETSFVRQKRIADKLLEIMRNQTL